MAGLYKEAGDYQTALAYVNQGAEVGRKYKTGWLLEREKAELFGLMEHYDSAAVYTSQLKSTSSENAWNNLTIGNDFLVSKHADSALHYLLKTHKTFRNINQMAHFSVPVSLKIAEAYMMKNEFSTAKKYVTDAMELAIGANSRPDLMKGYDLLSKIHYKTGNSDSAYVNLRRYVALKDSIQSRQFFFRLSNAKKEAQIGFLKRDNLIKKEQLRRQGQSKNFSIIGMLVFMVIGVLVMTWVSLKRKNEKLSDENIKAELRQRATELEMQALRAQMNPHFIFNCLSSINRFILKNETKEASKYLTRFSRLMRMVLHNSNKRMITLEDEVQMLQLYLEMERVRFKNAFSYNISYLNEIDADNVFVPPLLLQPFCENAIWHGLMNLGEGNNQGRLDIMLQMVNESLHCTISDNGIGRKRAEELKTKSVEKDKPLGINITRDRLALINRSSDFQSFFKIDDLMNDEGQPAGTKVTLIIKCQQQSEPTLA